MYAIRSYYGFEASSFADHGTARQEQRTDRPEQRPRQSTVRANEDESILTRGSSAGSWWQIMRVIDFLTGDEISFSLFYLLPIFLITWFTGKRFGVAASIISALAWFLAEKASDHVYSLSIIYYWNSAIRFGFFIIVTLLLSRITSYNVCYTKLLRWSQIVTTLQSSNFP